MSRSGEVGRLSAALTLDGAEQFQRELNRVGDTFQRTGGRGEAFGKAVSNGVKTAAGATTALTAAAAGYLAILTTTGVAYNSLQQNSRAALSVMLGGAEKASAQMDKLDAFARNSPFSKQVFVSAQQQMIAFGIETQKVIPYLDALQNAVAASGGSNTELEGLTAIFAKIKSSAKITAVDLMQFGNYGVDAATIIGAQMGKTGAEIRDEITEGTLDAQVALDALAAGMQATYGGSTDLIKQQWSGAVDRVRAANRDIGAAIAEPFVSKNGGGLAVQWANQIADVLRAVEKQTVPVMEILTERGRGFFAGLANGLDTAQASVERFNPETIETVLDRIGGHAPAIAATAGAVLALGANVGPLGKFFGALGLTINPVVAAVIGLAAASPELRAGFVEVLEAGKPLVPVVGEFATILSGMLSSALPIVADGLGLVAKVAGPLVGFLADLPAPLLLGVAGFLALQKVLGPVEGGLGKFVEGLVRFGQQSQVQATLGETSTGIGAISTASMNAKTGVRNLGAAMKTAFLSNPIGIALTVVSVALAAWVAANAAAEQKVAAHNERVTTLRSALNQTTGAMNDAARAQVEKNLADTRAEELAQKMGIAYRDVELAALGNEEAQRRVNEAMSEYSIGTGLMFAKNDVEELTTTIGEQVAAVDEAQRATREKISADREAAAAMTEAERSNSRLNEAISVARDVSQDATTRLQALKQALDELKGGAISTEEAQKRLSETNLTLAEGLAQTDEAGGKLWASTLDGAGNISLASREGLAFANAMSSSRDAMLEAAMAAADNALANGDYAGAVEAATAAGEGYVATLRTTMEQAGLTGPMIDALIGNYLDVPGVVATILTDEGTISSVDQQVLALVGSLSGLPPGTEIIVDDPNSPAVIQRIEELGGKVETLPDGTIKITQTGADIVEGILQGLTKPRSVPISIVTGQQLGPVKADGSSLTGNMYSQGKREAFATGGFPSGIYSAPAGQDAIYKFAERELPWEVFISPKPGHERKNANLALEALRRLGFPSIPIASLGGVRGFAEGGFGGGGTAAPQAAGARPTSVGRSAPLVETVILGQGVTRNEFAELEAQLDYYERGI